jgi:branched-chain amino acid transport system permease protein
MGLWLTLAVNSIALGGLLFLLSAGFSLIFGLMRIPNLMHGSFFMLGAYFGVSVLNKGYDFWVAALLSAAAMAVIGALVERFLLRRLAGQELAQVLLTLGLSFVVADTCLMVWTRRRRACRARSKSRACSFRSTGSRSSASRW